METAYGYVRVSTLRQGKGVSLAEQKSAIIAFAKRHNIHIVRFFEIRKIFHFLGGLNFKNWVLDFWGSKPKNFKNPR